MANPQDVRPDEVEILVARELRKAGLALSSLRVVSRAAGPDDAGGGYVIRLAGAGDVGGSRRDVVVVFRNQREPVGTALLQDLAVTERAVPARDAPVRLIPVVEAAADAAVEPPIRVVCSTSGYALDAVRAAPSLGVVLLAVADGAAAFRRSQWSMGQTTPAWVPEYMTELVSLAPDGAERRELVVPGRRTLGAPRPSREASAGDA
jgi:hypothetical protein